MTADPTDLDRERARETCPCWGDGVTGPPTCGHAGMCELHQRIAEGYAAVRAEGREEGYLDGAEKGYIAGREAGARDMRERVLKYVHAVLAKWNANADRPQSEHSGPSYAAAVAGAAATHDIAEGIRALPLSEPLKELK